MMRIIVEIHPGGDERRKRTMVVADVANVTGLDPWSDYEVDALFNPTQIDERRVREKVFQHERQRGWAMLVRRVFERIEHVTDVPAKVESTGEKR